MAASATAGAPVAHHFDNLRQQQSTVRFGMWIFLVTEVLFFAGAFVAYTAYRIWFPRDFEAGSAVLNVGIATVNTFLLLLSSLTITLGIRACYVGDQAGLRRWLMATIVLGTAFLLLKAREYHLDYEEGLIPSARMTQVLVPGSSPGAPVYRDEPVFVGHFRTAAEHAHVNLEGVNPIRVQLFFMFYYSMTGLHVLHMIIGLGLLAWQYVLARQGFFTYPQRYVYVEVMSLYWHFVDMVWMFLLPLLYLAGPHNWGQVAKGLEQAFNFGGH
ncbi:MAG TPA: cytochrome c oxidase subunit 3 [Fimbriiglobus sp.]|nr:cytochrome c oxidase subunit 3 [Fimbriiglobus sp.]